MKLCDGWFWVMSTFSPISYTYRGFKWYENVCDYCVHVWNKHKMPIMLACPHISSFHAMPVHTHIHIHTQTCTYALAYSHTIWGPRPDRAKSGYYLILIFTCHGRTTETSVQLILDGCDCRWKCLTVHCYASFLPAFQDPDQAPPPEQLLLDHMVRWKQTRNAWVVQHFITCGVCVRGGVHFQLWARNVVQMLLFPNKGIVPSCKDSVPFYSGIVAFFWPSFPSWFLFQTC